MINLFNMDIDQIKHNNDYVILMKLNGDIVYENIGYCVEYTVEPIAFPLNSEDSYGEYYCLPRFYTQSNIYSPRYDYEKIKIIKKDGTVTTDISTNCSAISKIMIWFPIDAVKINFQGNTSGDPNSIIKTIKYYDTSKLTTMYFMFFCCDSLLLTNSDEWDTSNVTDMSYMFNGCESLTILDLSNFNTSNVTNMQNMFNGCSKLTSLDVSNFNTSNVTNMSYMFWNCNQLTSLDVSNFDTSNVTDIKRMFYNCQSLAELDVSNFDISNVTDMSYMFDSCESLISLDLSNWDIANVTDASSMFYYCKNLTNFKSFKNISTDISFSGCPLTYTSIMSIINNLATVTSTKTLTLGSTNLAKLNSYEIYQATNKGWTVK